MSGYESMRGCHAPAAHEAHAPGEVPFVYDDGGRSAAGFGSLVLNARGPGDCWCRAIAIATGQAYRDVHQALAELAGDPEPVDTGLPLGVGADYLTALGWRWTLNQRMAIARPDGYDVEIRHHRIGDLPRGRFVLEFRRRDGGHVAALVDGRLRDLDATPGTWPVWGWWSSPATFRDDPRPRVLAWPT